MSPQSFSKQNPSPLVQLARDLRPDRLLPGLIAGLVIGILNAILGISLAALIFSGELSAYLPAGIGLVLIGDAVMCALVALISSHSSTIAVDQDAPAAILAAVIAGALAAMPAGSVSEQKFLTGVMLMIGTTLLTGLCFLALGCFKLGGLVRFLPYPVVGGFLAATGWLLLIGGMGIMAGTGLGFTLFQFDSLVRWLPGIGLALVLIVVLNRVKHPLTIPGAIAVAMALFYITAGASGASLADLGAQGWLLGEFPSGGLWQFPLASSSLAQVDWPVVVENAVNVLPILLISVVMLLLNVSGVELIVKQDIDLNRELIAAGLGNVVGGAFGAIVGFHAISFSGLNHRMSHSSRVTALVAAAFCVLVVLLGPLVLAYMPRFILGGLVAYLGLSLLDEWIVQARKRFPRLEYFVIWLILAVSALFSFLEGVTVGLLVAVGLFVVNYSRINVVKHTLSGASFQSRVTRASRLRTILYARSDQTHILQLQGYLFFGTAHRLLELVRGRLQQTDVPPVRFLVLDFRQVTGLDSTAILSFAKMKHLAHDSAAVLIFTGLSPTLEAQFVSNRLGGAEDTVKVFPDLDRAVEWCEAEILRVEGVEDEAESIQQHIEQILPEAGNMEALLQYLKREEVAQGAYLFRQGDAPDVLYLVEKGQVTAQLESASEKAPTRLETMRGGRVVGEIGFYRGVARSAAVRADEPTVVYSLARAQLKQMEQADPETASTFHRLMVHLLAERVTHLIRAVDALLK